MTLGGETSAVLMRDLSAAEFFFGFPVDDDPGPGVLGEWEDGVLARAAIHPRLTVELVRRLGADRSELWRSYAVAVGWVPPADDAAPVQDVPAFCRLLMPERVEPESPRRALDVLRPFVTLPAGLAAKQLGLLVERTGVLPATLWQLPISEFLFTFRYLAATAKELG